MWGQPGCQEVMRILLVENNLDTAHIFQEFLTSLGHQNFFCAYGERALYYANLYKPNVVLMSTSLPGQMNGIQSAEAIIDALDIPIIFLTVHTEMFQEAVQIEGCGFLLKSCTPRELQIALKLAIKTKKDLHVQKQYITCLEQAMKQHIDLLMDVVSAYDYSQKLMQEISLKLFGYDQDHGTLHQMMEEYEEFLLVRTLKHARDNVAITARALGIDRSTLYRKCRKYGIEIEGEK